MFDYVIHKCEYVLYIVDRIKLFLISYVTGRSPIDFSK